MDGFLSWCHSFCVPETHGTLSESNIHNPVWGNYYLTHIQVNSEGKKEHVEILPDEHGKQRKAFVITVEWRPRRDICWRDGVGSRQEDKRGWTKKEKYDRKKKKKGEVGLPRKSVCKAPDNYKHASNLRWRNPPGFRGIHVHLRWNTNTG